jgi:hypothetical protein
MALLDPSLRKTKKLDKEYLQKTEVPLITVSGTYREDLKGVYDLPEDDSRHDLVFSRAHFSMTIAAAVTAWKHTINPKKAWIVDPTNYVVQQDWASVLMVEKIGKIIARYPFLKTLKDFVDKFGRRKLPILASITPPLMDVTRGIHCPILSFHIAAGNILLEQGKPVIQVITDPHVREEYLANCERPDSYYCVFDEATKEEFLKKAHELGKKMNEKRVIITGPPIDPRILKLSEEKPVWKGKRALRLCLTTGGLGTNKPEIEAIVTQMVPQLKKAKPNFQLMVYAGTHRDIKDMVTSIAENNDVPYREITAHDPAEFSIGSQLSIDPKKVQDISAPLTVIYHPQIIDANELLIHYGFPWADGFISKPSGDMAYDAVGSGAFLLTLAEWGEWENNIRAKFRAHGVSKIADTKDIVKQLEKLCRRSNDTPAWVTRAMEKTRILEEEDPFFRSGTKNILKTFKEIKETI